jgi:hypothetical protein
MAKPFRFQARNQKPEGDFRAMCIRYLKIRFGSNFWHVKILGGIGQRSGIPDDLCCIKGKDGEGRFYAFEWKDPGRKPRIGPCQEKEIKAIQASGGKAAVIASFEDLEKAISDLPAVQTSIKDLL